MPTHRRLAAVLAADTAIRSDGAFTRFPAGDAAGASGPVAPNGGSISADRNPNGEA